ncbi:MAG: nitroreductase family protein [Bdellovibrionales bacterium]|nr:nitroreductase family protein [Bdellovibrionales bacterium]
MEEFFNAKNSYREPEINGDVEEFKKVVKSRRSVRRFSDEAIPHSIIKDCIELALLAPNSSNLQQWEFHWIQTPETRKRLDEAFFSQPACTTAAELVVAVARTATWKKHNQKMIETMQSQGASSAISYYKKIVPLAYTIGWLGTIGWLKKLLFFVMGFFQPMPREVTSKSELKIWAVKSTALACQNLMLALRAYGYDSCPMEGFDSRRVKKILNLPSDAVVVMGVSAGKRAENGIYGPRLRFDSSQFIKLV